jgi:hypothetical protein
MVAKILGSCYQDDPSFVTLGPSCNYLCFIIVCYYIKMCPSFTTINFHGKYANIYYVYLYLTIFPHCLLGKIINVQFIWSHIFRNIFNLDYCKILEGMTNQSSCKRDNNYLAKSHYVHMHQKSHVH